ncbi:hypothetical protein DRI50_09615, partial [candidate division KSB1 bacterium]
MKLQADRHSGRVKKNLMTRKDQTNLAQSREDAKKPQSVLCPVRRFGVSAPWRELYFACMVFAFLIVVPVWSQESPADTAASAPLKNAATPIDSTTSKPIVLKEQPSDIDTTIYYEAKLLDNDLSARRSYFIGDASVKYKDITLKAGKITIDWDSNIILAEPIPDTTWVKTDSLGADSTMHIKMIGEPVLVESGTTMSGQKMEYNYRTEKGLVIKGRSDVEGGKYVGTQIKRINSRAFNVSHSSYTTCDIDSSPHFHFEARR